MLELDEAEFSMKSEATTGLVKMEKSAEESELT